jgi:hypothetical protein
MFCVWQKKQPVRPEEISTESKEGNVLWALLTQCWSNDPKQRPTAVDVAEVVGPVLPVLVAY